MLEILGEKNQSTHIVGGIGIFPFIALPTLQLGEKAYNDWLYFSVSTRLQ